MTTDDDRRTYVDGIERRVRELIGAIWTGDAALQGTKDPSEQAQMAIQKLREAMMYVREGARDPSKRV